MATTTLSVTEVITHPGLSYVVLPLDAVSTQTFTATGDVTGSTILAAVKPYLASDYPIEMTVQNAVFNGLVTTFDVVWPDSGDIGFSGEYVIKIDSSFHHAGEYVRDVSLFQPN